MRLNERDKWFADYKKANVHTVTASSWVNGYIPRHVLLTVANSHRTFLTCGATEYAYACMYSLCMHVHVCIHLGMRVCMLI